MPKKRKTRQEKVIADLRRILVTQQPTKSPSVASTVYSLPKIQSPVAFATTNQQPKTHDYTYVLSDLRKTLILTTIAIAAQITLFFVLNK